MPDGCSINIISVIVAGLTAAAVLLTASAYVIRRCTVRIYNWNGKRYCYLGRARLYRGFAGYRIVIGEHMADLSYTTLYRICPSRRFVHRNKYKDIMLCAGQEKCMLTIDERMERSVYYRQQYR